MNVCLWLNELESTQTFAWPWSYRESWWSVLTRWWPAPVSPRQISGASLSVCSWRRIFRCPELVTQCHTPGPMVSVRVTGLCLMTNVNTVNVKHNVGCCPMPFEWWIVHGESNEKFFKLVNMWLQRCQTKKEVFYVLLFSCVCLGPAGVNIAVVSEAPGSPGLITGHWVIGDKRLKHSSDWPRHSVNKEVPRVGAEMIFLETKEVFISPRSFGELNLSVDFIFPASCSEGRGGQKGAEKYEKLILGSLITTIKINLQKQGPNTWLMLLLIGCYNKLPSTFGQEECFSNFML